MKRNIRWDIYLNPSGNPMLLESNQNHATITELGICTSLPASMGEGGGYIPMIVMQRRFSKVNVMDTETAPCLEHGAGAGAGGNNLPMILERKAYDRDSNVLGCRADNGNPDGKEC